MDESRLVDGAGWISDDSDFYGHEALRKKLQTRSSQELNASAVTAPAYARQTKEPFDIRQVVGRRNMLQMATASDLAVKSSKDAAVASHHVDRFLGNPSAWQQHETIANFTRRAPVHDPSTADLGPWLWVGNPIWKPEWQQREAKTDTDAFVEGGIPLLQAHSALRTKMEKASPETPVGTITRRLGPYRDQLENDLFALAKKTSTTCGKWMLFPSNEDCSRYWRVVAEATAESRLGPTSKAATPDPVEPLNLICVYTYDFTDADDVRRVLRELIDLGLCIPDGKPLYYKCDAYTYLDIKSGNDYKLRASVYSSKELLGQQAKPKKEGPVDRSVKRKVAADSSWMF